MPIWQTIEKLLTATSSAETNLLVRSHAARMGFDNVGFAARASAAMGASGEVVTAHSYNSEWAASYQRLSNPLSADLDARVLVSKRNLPATAWTTCGQISLPMLAVLIPSVKKQLGIAGEFGMRGGITVPIQGRGIDWGFFTFSTNSSSELEDLGACLGDAMLLCGVAASRMASFTHSFQHRLKRYPPAARSARVKSRCCAGAQPAKHRGQFQKFCASANAQ